MAKLRSLSTAFWSDPFIEDLTPQQKLLFIYLVTNDKTNMLGIYESSIKKMSFETGINKNDIEKSLKEFQKKGKVKYIDNYVVLVNYMKHQNFNTNMKKSAIDTYNDLPKELKDNTLIVDKSNPLKGFERLLNHYGMVRKVEVEYELEDEIEVPKPKNKYHREFAHLSITKEDFEKLCVEYEVKIVNKVLDNIENYKNNKNYKSLYLTAKNWLSKEPKKKIVEEQEKQATKTWSVANHLKQQEQ